MNNIIKNDGKAIELNVEMFADERIQKLINCYGAKAVAVLIEVFCRISNEKPQKLYFSLELVSSVSEELDISGNEVEEIIKTAVNLRIFRKSKFEENNVLIINE